MVPRLRMTTYGVDPSGSPLDRFGLSRPVWLLGWVSFFTDTASEMVYPLRPLFFPRVPGASTLCLARCLSARRMPLVVSEGVAGAASSILNIVPGRIADRTGEPKKLVLA